MIVTNQRIKKLRKELDITQQEFAERIGVSRANIGKYETGISEPSAAVLSLICREFDVNEEWLRTGEGEMFKPKPSDILDQLAYKYQFSNADYVIVEKFVSLKPEKRTELLGDVFDFLHEVEAALSDSNPYAQAYSGNEPPMPMDSFMESITDLRNKNAITDMTVDELEAEYKKSRSDSAQKTESSASNTTAGIEKGNDDKSASNQ